MELYHTTDTDGVSEINPCEVRMRETITQLDAPDAEEIEHPDVALVHDSTGWSISLFPSGVVTFENLGDAQKEPLYLTNIDRDRAFELWQSLAAGKIEKLLALPWQQEKA